MEKTLKPGVRLILDQFSKTDDCSENNYDFQTKDSYNCRKCNKDFSNAEELGLGAYHKYVEQIFSATPLNDNSIEDLRGLLESFIR